LPGVEAQHKELAELKKSTDIQINKLVITTSKFNTETTFYYIRKILFLQTRELQCKTKGLAELESKLRNLTMKGQVGKGDLYKDDILKHPYSTFAGRRPCQK
jgi:Flp pilus assembly CpaF family ATPase